MIALISGRVAVRRADHVVVDTGGVGYRLSVSAETLKHVPAVDQEVMLHTHLVVRDDALALYGFATEEERDLFLMLLGVQTVGPKVALAVLSTAPPRRLMAAVASGEGPPAARARRRQADGRADHRRAAGEGRRRALPATRPGGVTDGRAGDGADPDGPATVAREALTGLGYAPNEIDALLKGAAGVGSAEELIAHALRSARR